MPNTVTPTDNNYLNVFTNLGKTYIEGYLNKKYGIREPAPRPPNPNPGNIITNFNPQRPSVSDNLSGGLNQAPINTAMPSQPEEKTNYLYWILGFFVFVLIVLRLR